MELEHGSRSWLMAKAEVGACGVTEHGAPVRAHGSVATFTVTGFWAALLGG